MYGVRMNIIKQKATWEESGTETKLLESVSCIYSKPDKMEAPIQISVLSFCLWCWHFSHLLQTLRKSDEWWSVVLYELRASKQPLLVEKKNFNDVS